MKITILINDKEALTMNVDVKGKKRESCCMMINSVDFAVYLNDKAKERNMSVNKTKLQKLLYICYGSYLALNNGEQLLDEMPNAWDFGPAFPNVYDAQKNTENGLDGRDVVNTEMIVLNRFDALIKSVLDFFGEWTSEQLVEWTHQVNTAWYKRYHTERSRYTPLNNCDITKDFERYITA